ncbi:MAG: hypothetical protein JSW34_01105 [Candidatus Zixiibacteriota bacterium]|nr:MAG: hypothetical protein JSW34_01105 [candidate division Zixibacteria bacterium]
MAAEEDKSKKPSAEPVSEAQRFRYIGFEVFPGKPKDHFKSEAERDELVKSVQAKREKGDLLREQCTLMEERVSFADRLVMTVASVLILVTLFLPWYAAYNEIVEENVEPEVTEQVAVVADSLADSTVLAGTADSLAAVEDSAAAAAVEGAAAPPAGTPETGQQTAVTRTGVSEELIHGYVAKKKIHKEYSRLSAIGSFIALGSVGSYVFSSGGILVITAILFLIYTLLCVGLPVYTLYGIYGTKGDADSRALKLKKMVRLNWVPLILFVLALVLSFVGAEYGFDSAETFVSLGKSYGPGAFLGALSWGIILSLSAFILVAVKGIEI